MTRPMLVDLQLLSEFAGFSESQSDSLSHWWQATARIGEALPDFLLRQSLLSESNSRILIQVAQGHLAWELGRVLLDRGELERLRRRLPDLIAVDNSCDKPPTVSLLGDDTAQDAAVASPHLMELNVGSRLGKYLLAERIGCGTTGNVFRSYHPTLQIPVAIKALTPRKGVGRDRRIDLFRTEAKLLAELSHPHIVRVFDFDHEGETPFLVLEYVNGLTLGELIDQSGRLRPDRAAAYFRQIARAITQAHSRGVIHRDLKPANVLLTREGQVKLADLGLAVMRSDRTRSAATSRSGTVDYMAPEVIDGELPASEASDAYSFGATLFHAVVGQPPFVANNPWDVLKQHLYSQPPVPRDVVPEIPESMSDFILNLLSKNPADRLLPFEKIAEHPGLNPGVPVGWNMFRNQIM